MFDLFFFFFFFFHRHNFSKGNFFTLGQKSVYTQPNRGQMKELLARNRQPALQQHGGNKYGDGIQGKK